MQPVAPDRVWIVPTAPGAPTAAVSDKDEALFSVNAATTVAEKDVLAVADSAGAIACEADPSAPGL